MKLLDLVRPNCIVAELASTDRNGVIRELVQVLGDAKLIQASAIDGIVRSIVTRERTRGTTGFGKGVAVPHAKVEGLGQIVAAIGRSKEADELLEELDVIGIRSLRGLRGAERRGAVAPR